jgi:hypothetical protein
MERVHRPHLGRSAGIIAAIIAVLAGSSGLTFGLLTGSVNIAASGVFTSVNIGVYTTQQCTANLTSIDWGTVSPGSSYTRTGYVRNNGSVGMTLSMTTTGWNPAGASAIGVSWNYDGRTLSPGQVLAVTWTLIIPSTISGVQSFSFNIVVTGSG